MSYGTVVMKIPILFLLSFLFLKTNGDVYYVPQFTDAVLSCDDFNNDFFNCDELVLGSMQGEEGDDAAKLSGKIKTGKEFLDEYDLEIDIWKMLDLADEYMYSTRVNFCSSLQNTDSPWYPVLEKLNISGCPVPESTFEVHGLSVSLDAFKDFLNHDFCGEYRVQLSFMDGTEKISCHILELCIVERNDEDE